MNTALQSVTALWNDGTHRLVRSVLALRRVLNLASSMGHRRMAQRGDLVKERATDIDDVRMVGNSCGL